MAISEFSAARVPLCCRAMQSLWNDADAPGDPLALRAYTSRLLGREPSLVLHGGGNTSVKLKTTDFFGDAVDVLYVKGSGWDLASIEPAGFSPVRLDVLERMAELPALSDSDMVREQRAALLHPSAPNPSVEAILHAVLPQRFVDHTHADAVVTLSNTPDGERRVRELYGDRVIVVPYVMPGFVLARKVWELTRGIDDWSRIEGMVLLHHGVFSFADDARESYERMIRLVTDAERLLVELGAWNAPAIADDEGAVDLAVLADLRHAVSAAAGRPMIARFDGSPAAHGFASRADIADLATRGPVTPDHVIRVKRVPVVLAGDVSGDVESYAQAYRAYFARHDDGKLTCLDPAPRWAVWKDRGVVAFGTTAKAADEVVDIARHSVRCFQWGEGIGGWRPLSEAALFEMEYWELEQRKLRQGGSPPALSGKIALVTGGATGIGRATAEQLRASGAAVCVLDLKSEVQERFAGADAIGIVCDVTDSSAVDDAVRRCARTFGGLDIVVSNAGNFPPTERIADIDDDAWRKTMDLNLNGHMRVIRAAVPFLERGIEPAIVVVASRNVPAPGPGAAAYSASKAALTQLARVAALELGPRGVRVNLLHPDKVFDTELWDEEKIALRAKAYGLSIEDYKRNNLLGVEVRAADVAALACAMVGPLFRTTTGAQIPVDGGNDRVI
jgi:rhamnose utilization protein RhaD (predicted bifunctional aldolase and dehydrogenase)/NAD(P)-dependent dehydrogenase (short-subunit alcohol dehydrogenase family)